MDIQSTVDKEREFAQPRRIGFLLIDGFALLSYAAAVEPLRAANLLAGHTLYDVRELPADGAIASSSSGAQVRASAHVGEHVDYDLMMVVAGGDPVAFVSRRVSRWLQHLDRRGVVLGGISGGPVVLASAGVMAGRRMTVHWEHRALVGNVAPTAIIERSRYVIDQGRLTCAGGTAALDMMHAMILGDHGADFARSVVDWFLHTEVQPSGGPQRSEPAKRWDTRNSVLLAALHAMEDHIADPLELTQIASIAGVGPRQLNRLFNRRFGIGVIARYRALRLEKAHALLLRSSLPVAEVASATGFASATHFSRRFREQYGTSPSGVRSC